MVPVWLNFGSLFVLVVGCSSTSVLVNVRPSEETEAVRIPGTQLFTEIFYRLNLKTNDGLMTWSYDKVETYNNMQIIFGEGAAKDYGIAGTYRRDAQWKFVATEVPDNYLLVNRAQPNATLTWAGKSTSGKYAVLYLDAATNPDYQAGGQYRTDALWRIEPEEGCPFSGEYFIRNSRYPNNGILTWESKDIGVGKKYLQIYPGGKYEDYEHNSDYLWQLTPISDYPN